jgi:hypothetical protein
MLVCPVVYTLTQKGTSNEGLLKMSLVVPCLAALLSFSAPLSAQDVGIVNVDLTNAKILQNIANQLNVDVSNVPITVQAPISVAAAVCGVAVDVLSSAINHGGASCYAQSQSRALNKIVQNVMNLQFQKPQ